MSAWSQPYLSVWDATGARAAWQLPDPLPWAAGATFDADLRTAVPLGLPAGGKLKVRWRTPEHANPRSYTQPTSDLQTVALACDVLRAAQARGHGWVPDELGWPHLVPLPDDPEPAAEVLEQAPGTPAEPADVADETGAWVGAWSAVSPDNPVLAAVRAGRRPLGSTVAQIITAVRREREEGWSTKHKVNMLNVLGFIEQLLVYQEPDEDEVDGDLPEVAAWMRARLALPGVELGASMHVALLLTPDLTWAIERRRYTDRRVQYLNEQAVQRYLTQYERYERLMADRSVRPRGGRPPKPPAEPVLRVPKVPCDARTEELFATGLSMVLGYAEQHGLLAGPNPWHSFVGRGSTATGYRRAVHVPPHLRNVPPVGCIVQIANAVAKLGPVDPTTHRPVGERYRALILVLLAGLRPSEADALGPDDFRQDAQPALFVSKSAGVVLKAAAAGDSTFEVRPFGKTNKVRLVPIATSLADALRAHLAAGYASEQFLFTGPDGGPVRWGNLVDTYWRPAVQQVLGSSADPILRDMPRKWIRKVAITWMLRAGLGVEQVAGYTGHDVVTLFHHYAGVVAGHGDRHTWAGWDAAWGWAVQETSLP